MFNNMSIEAMDHIANSFAQDEENPHPLQRGELLKVHLFYIVKISLNSPEYSQRCLLKGITIKVPKNLQISRMRELLKHCETELVYIFGSADRCKFYFIQQKGRNDMEVVFGLPTHGILFL